MDKINKKYFTKLFGGTVILLANVSGRTTIYTDNLNIIAEYFSKEEFEYIYSNLQNCGYDVLCYYNENDFIKDYLNNKIKLDEFIVFNFARNGYGVGKKSLIPAFCDLNGIKYTSSNAYACSFARHKFHVNSLLKYLNLNYLETYLYNGEWLPHKPSNYLVKYIIKPAFESASQGVYSQNIVEAKDYMDLNQRVEYCFSTMNHVPLLIQQFIAGYEAKTTLIDFEKTFVLPPIGVEINEKHDFYNDIITADIAFEYNHKNYLLSSELGEKLAQKIETQAITIYKSIGMQNYGRIDCRIDNKTGEVYFMDFSTMPYFVSDGEMLFAYNAIGQEIGGLLNSIINSALVSKYHYSL